MHRSKILTNILDIAASNPNKVILSELHRKFTWEQILKLARDHHQKIKESCKHAVVFYADNNANSVAVILACVENNLTFIPIARDQPEERIRSILKILSLSKIYDPSTGTFDDYVENENSHENIFDNVLYILFTSGSTGSPKGVKISEFNLLSTLQWSRRYFNWKSSDIIGLVTSLNFDISIFDLFIGLISNVQVHMFSQVKNLPKLYSELLLSQVTSIFSTPSLFSQIAMSKNWKLIHDSKLRQIISGGDFFVTSDLIFWKKNLTKIEIYNVWGPTETSIVNTAYKVEQSDIREIRMRKPLPIGSSTPEMIIRICDAEADVVKWIDNDNEIGELVVQGSSVGLGYINNNEQTQKNFMIVDGVPTYRTGDMGYTEKGLLYLIGRNANLIKYQGYRIDPREIETIILESTKFQNACLVIAEGRNLRHELVLLIEVTKNSHADISYVKGFLRDKVPSYMVPKKVLFVESIPFTENGKLDRKKCRLIAEESGRLKID